MDGQRSQRPPRRRPSSTTPEARWRTWANLLPHALAADAVSPVPAIGRVSAANITPRFELHVDTTGDELLNPAEGVNRTSRGPGKNQRPITRRKRLRPPHIGRNIDLEA